MTVKKAALGAVLAALVWAAALILFGGFDFHVSGARVRSNDAFRPLFLALVAFAVALAAGGPEYRRAWLARLSRADDRLLVALLAAWTLWLGVSYNTTAAAGADAYGYVSEADRWIDGGLRTPQPWVADLPWPARGDTAAPLGYKSIERNGQWILVPTYSPGVPLLMAGAKKIAGHGAMFWIVPLFGAIAVLATYGIGRRLGSPSAGLVGAWLTATSPPFIYTLIQPWSDVPATAAWAAAFYFVLGSTTASAAAAGAAAALAIAIRPNIVWAAGVLGLWFVMRLLRDDSRTRSRVLLDGVAFAVFCSIGIAIVAAIYQYLYGSPVESGYGRFSANFSLARTGANLVRYTRWIAETGTPVAFLGIVALIVPLRRVWPAVRDRRVFIPIGLFVAGLWLMYCSYLVFEGWPFLRFLLPSYPLMMLGTGALAVALVRSRGTAGILAVIALGLFFQFRTTVSTATLGLWRTERRYVAAGQLARTATEDNSVLFSMGHSGSGRYYAGRMTLRYDLLDPDWLDRGLEFLSQHGAHPYLLVEDWEVAEFERRFAGQRGVAFVHSTPIFVYRGFGTVLLFDLRDARHGPARIVNASFQATRNVPPAPRPDLRLAR